MIIDLAMSLKEVSIFKKQSIDIFNINEDILLYDISVKTKYVNTIVYKSYLTGGIYAHGKKLTIDMTPMDFGIFGNREEVTTIKQLRRNHE